MSGIRWLLDAHSIECRILAENEGALKLSVAAEFTSEAPRESGFGFPSLFRSRVHVTVELDKPTVISRIDDPDGDSSYTIESSATRIRER